MKAEACYETLKPYLAHLQNAILTSPLEKDERAKLASMIAGATCSVAVECSILSSGLDGTAGRETTMTALFELIGQSIRVTQAPILNG